MKLFDDDIFDNEETTQNEVFNDRLSKDFIKWKDKILSIPMSKGTFINNSIIHNVCNIIDDINSLTMVFDGSVRSNSIVCPIEFITDCPKVINIFDIDNYNSEEKLDIILYSRNWYDENDELKENLITSEDIDLISTIQIVHNNINSIIVKGSFDKLDTFYKFIDSFKQFNTANFFIHYDSKIYGINCKKKRNRICDLMHDGILNVDETFPLVSYTGFINNCMIPELENKKE